MITEMLHTATLIHDDVIDASDARRGKASVNLVWGQRKVGYKYLTFLHVLLVTM